MKNRGILFWLTVITAVVCLISMIIGSFDWAAKPVASMVGSTVENVKYFARTVTGVAMGALTIFAGIATIAGAPILGAILLAVGVGAVVISLWSVLSPSSSE